MPLLYYIILYSVSYSKNALAKLKHTHFINLIIYTMARQFVKWK